MARLTQTERAAELARIKAENEARKQRIAASRGVTQVATVAPTVAEAPTVLNEFQEATPGVYFDLSRLSTSDIVAAISGGPDLNQFIEQTPGLPFGTAATTRPTTTVTGAVTAVTGAVTSVVGGTGADFDQNAFDIVKDLLKKYNIEELESVVRGWIENKVSEEAAIANLRGTDAYKTRFKGNELRRAAGLNVFDEGTYLAQENDYEEWARYYGVLGKLGDTTQKRRETFANLMANSVFTPEYKTRLETYVDRVDRGDPGIKRTLRSFYNITDDDLLNYFINPKENIKVLQEKVTAAEIGAAATAQGLGASRARAEDLARFGIDRATAIAGYQDIAAALPRGQMLGGIYREEGIDYTQQTAEEEEFKQMESARRARRRLAEREAATFGGGSAVARGSLGSSTAGAI